MIFVKSKEEKAKEAALLKEQLADERAAYKEKEKREVKEAKQEERKEAKSTKAAEKEEAKSIKVAASETSSTGYRAAKGSVDPETGKKVGGQFVEPTTSQLGTSGDMLMTLQAIYQETTETGEVVEESDEHLEDIQAVQEDQLDELEGTGSEQRKDRIVASGKEKKDRGALGKFADGVSGAFGAVGRGFGSIKESLSGKLGLVALGGIMMLMSKYEEELFGPEGWVTKFLEWLKHSMVPAIKNLYEKFAVPAWDLMWDGVTLAFQWISDKFTAISDWYYQFDVDNIPGLSEDEKKAMYASLGEKAGDIIQKVMLYTIGAIGVYMLGKLFLGLAFTAAKTAILGSALFGGTAAVATGTGAAAIAAAATRAKVIAFAGKFSIGAAIAFGIAEIWKTTTNTAAEAARDTEGNIVWSDFWSKWIGGSEGSKDNAIKNMFSKAKMGGGIGAGIGLLVGGPPGALIGGLLGMMTGGLAGYLTGQAGQDGLKPVFEKIGLDWMDSKNALFRYFKDLFGPKGIQSIIPKGELERDLEEFQQDAESARYTNVAQKKILSLVDSQGWLEEDRNAAYLEWERIQKIDVPSGVKNPEAFRTAMMLDWIEKYAKTEIKHGLTFEAIRAAEAQGGAGSWKGGVLSEIAEESDVKGREAEKEIIKTKQLIEDNDLMLLNEQIRELKEKRDPLKEELTGIQATKEGIFKDVDERQARLLTTFQSEHQFIGMDLDPDTPGVQLGVDMTRNERVKHHLPPELTAPELAFKTRRQKIQEDRIRIERREIFLQSELGRIQVALETKLVKASILKGVPYLADEATMAEALDEAFMPETTLSKSEIDFKMRELTHQFMISKKWRGGANTEARQAELEAFKQGALNQIIQDNSTKIAPTQVINDMSVYNRDPTTQMLSAVGYIYHTVPGR